MPTGTCASTTPARSLVPGRARLRPSTNGSCSGASWPRWARAARAPPSFSSALPARFSPVELELALADLGDQLVTRTSARETIDCIRRVAVSNYDTVFPADSDLAERVLWPRGPTESHGMEDARFVRFVDDDGSVTYYATYTAFDGVHVAPQLLETTDFRALPGHPDDRPGRPQQGNGAVSPPDRRPLRRPLPLRPGEQHHRHLRRRSGPGARPSPCSHRRSAWELLQLGQLRLSAGDAGGVARPHPRCRTHAGVFDRRAPARPGRPDPDRGPAPGTDHGARRLGTGGVRPQRPVLLRRAPPSTTPWCCPTGSATPPSGSP